MTDELQFDKDGKIKLDNDTRCGALGADMGNGNHLEVHAHYEGKVWLVINTIKQGEGEEDLVTTMAYSLEAMMAMVTLFGGIHQKLMDKANGGLILPNEKKIITPGG